MKLARPEIDILREAWQDFARSADRLDLAPAEQGWTYDEQILTLDAEFHVSPAVFWHFTAELASGARCGSCCGDNYQLMHDDAEQVTVHADCGRAWSA